MELPLTSCVVRSWRMGDAAALARHGNNEKIWMNLRDAFPHPYTPHDAREFIKSLRHRTPETTFAIAVNGEAAGSVGFVLRQDVERVSAEIGYWLGVKHWGKGYATEAVRAVIDHTFTDLDCDAIHSSARVTNPASRRVLEKCGFQWTGAGLLRIRAIASSAPIDRFRLDRGLWASLKSWGAAKRIVA